MNPQISASGLGYWKETGRRGLAVVLSALMIMIPLGQTGALAQTASEPAPAPPASEMQPLSTEQLNQLVAPVALYPDALIAQVLTAATYPTQVVEADRWRQAQGNASPEQIAAGAQDQDWDPSVKALTAFPSVLSQMDRNLRWTTDLGNAYYNQPQDVMNAVQTMRKEARAAGNLRSTPQQVVTANGDTIIIVPANPGVVYVPVYDPWSVWGRVYPVYPGYYYVAPPGVFWGGLAVGFGLGIAVGMFSNWGWGWGHWGMGWRQHAVFYNHYSYYSHSRTVIDHGFNRPGGPQPGWAGRRDYPHPGGGAAGRPVAAYHSAPNGPRPGGSYRAANPAPRPEMGYHGTAGVPRPGNYSRPVVTTTRPGGVGYHAPAPYSRPAGNSTSAPRPSSSISRGPTGGGGHVSGGGGHVSGGHSGGGHSGGGHEGHGR